MNREILFKAKRTDNGEWVEGYYAVKGKGADCEKHFICVSTFDVNTSGYPFYFTDIEIDPKTVCQYTGLTDKNGKKIFYGDIVKEKSAVGIVKFGKYGNGFHYGFYIEWSTCPHLRPEPAFWDSKIQVVGNIFDNSELLEAG